MQNYNREEDQEGPGYRRIGPCSNEEEEPELHASHHFDFEIGR